MIPQIIYLFLAFAGLLIVANRHGQPKTDSYNIWVQLIATAISLGLLYWGGFFQGWMK